MDYSILRETLATTLDEIAFKLDNDGNNISIINKAQNDLKDYLENNTSISDDEKAKNYARFLTDTITGVTIQAIQVAGQAPLQSAQIDTMVAESAQKIISMQNEDKARLNDSAVNVAKAKAEIETLMPAQILKINAEILSLNKEVELKSKEIELREAELPFKEAQVLSEQKRLELMQAELPLREAQALLEAKKIELMATDILLKEKNITMEDKKIDLMEVQTEQEGVKIGLMQAQTEIEYAKLGLNAEQIRLTAMEAEYKKAQMQAVEKAGELNKEIEKEKNETQITIAEIYTYGRV